MMMRPRAIVTITRTPQLDATMAFLQARMIVVVRARSTAALIFGWRHNPSSERVRSRGPRI